MVNALHQFHFRFLQSCEFNSVHITQTIRLDICQTGIYLVLSNNFSIINWSLAHHLGFEWNGMVNFCIIFSFLISVNLFQ